MFARFLAPLAVTALSVVSVLPHVSCGPTPPGAIPLPKTPASGIDVHAFARELSKNAQIYVPDDSQFKTYTVRWSNLEAPTVNVVVLPATEQDVSKIVSHWLPCAPRVARATFGRFEWDPTQHHLSLCRLDVEHVRVGAFADSARERSNSPTSRTFPFSRTTGTMALSPRWERWTSALPST
jgi:hypothetical protein